MAILLANSGKIQLARSVRRDLVNTQDYYWVTLGKTTPWTDYNGDTDLTLEANPNAPTDNLHSVNDFRNNIIYAQLADSADICHLARRIDWTSGTVYDQYDDSYGRPYEDVWLQESPTGQTTHTATSGATTLKNANFYVMTDEYKVYKCMYNNNGGASTEKPISTDPTVVANETDGYRWKFLFQVSSSDQTKFLDVNNIPVRKLTTTPYGDVNGEIDSFTVTAGGSGYTTATAIVVGDGIGAEADVTITAGEVTAVTPRSGYPGSGYSFAFVTISGDGTGATATVNLGDTDALPTLQKAVEDATETVYATIDRIEILKQGSDYVSGDTQVVITGDGVGAEASAVINAEGQITGINVTDYGYGYSFADITFTDSSGVENTGESKAEARAIIGPYEGHGGHPVNELFANKLAIVLSTDEENNTDLFLNNDFRQIGLVKNIKQYGSKTTNFTQGTGNNTTRIEVGSSAQQGNYNPDDIITTNDGGKFRVIHKTESGSNYYVWMQPIINLISSSSTLTNTTTDTTGLSINSFANPEINVMSGDVVYIDNRPSINRQEDQVETIKAILTF